MNKFTTIVAVLTACPLIFAQSRVTLSGNTFIVLDNSVNLVLGNASTNALTNSGSGGILSENEHDQLIWKIGTSTGSYIVPFVEPVSHTAIPFTININTGGTGAGSIRFATYGGSIWDNNTYRPSDVTHMTDFTTGSVNNSANVIDRFWIADAVGYTTKPSGTFNFTYVDNEVTASGNTITESDLGAQRFNTSTGHWGDYLPQGTINTSANTVTNVPVNSSDFFRSWTLSEMLSPLPVLMSEMTGHCTDQQSVIEWVTENTNFIDYFNVEILDGNEFRNVATIDATNQSDYSYYLPYSDQTTYRIGMVNNNAVTTYSAPYAFECDSKKTSELVYNASENSWALHFVAESVGTEPLHVIDYSGKTVSTTFVSSVKGKNETIIPTNGLSAGVYLVLMKNGNELIMERIILSN